MRENPKEASSRKSSVALLSYEALVGKVFHLISLVVENSRNVCAWLWESKLLRQKTFQSQSQSTLSNLSFIFPRHLTNARPWKYKTDESPVFFFHYQPTFPYTTAPALSNLGLGLLVHGVWDARVLLNPEVTSRSLCAGSLRTCRKVEQYPGDVCFYLVKCLPVM